jgi:uncharacterized membrane protein
MSVITVHLAFAVMAILLVLAIFALPKGQRLHRLLGRGAAFAMVLTALSSFGIRASGQFSTLHILSLVTLTSMFGGVRAARAGNIRQHRRTMLGSSAGLLIAGLAAALIPCRLLHTLFFG